MVFSWSPDYVPCLICKSGGAGTKSERERGVAWGALRYQNALQKNILMLNKNIKRNV